MAEFKLGRIRFVWKGEWGSSGTYYKDDVVSFGGKVYICVIGHTSSPNFFTDFDVTPPKWNLVSDGQNYRGDWEPNTYYLPDDIVNWGARLYISQEAHVSGTYEEPDFLGLEADAVFDSLGKPTTGSKWGLFAEGLEWLGDWQPTTRYRINDFVKYGATTYVCKELHTSAADSSLGLESDSDKWDVFNRGIEYTGAWIKETRYLVNDVVQYGAGLWICTAPHTASTYFEDDNINWEQFVEGFQFEGEWSPFKHYQHGDLVRSGGNQYISVSDQVGNDPQTDDGTNWELFTQGIRFMGEWGDDSANIEYNVGELVSRGGYNYICVAKHTGFAPPNTDYWQQLSTGLRWKGIWLDDQEYILGDVVRLGSNSYVCVQGHISEGDDFSTVTTEQPGGGNANSRPDLDFAGQYWNLLSIGTETSILNTPGDLVFYSGAGPARLPIGEDGQLLQVSSEGLPEWTFYGVADDVYYVAEHGFDGPTPVYGRSLDRPFRSIRYACELIEKGAKNQKAAKLLELNRYFIQREITEWVDYQISTNSSPFNSSFTYAQESCQRDMGYIVDALIWDITHGGNVKTREAALEYVNNAPKFYTLGQSGETNAAINYGLTVIESVLNQEAPTVSYQVENGDNSTAIVQQYFDESLQAEDVLSEITSLVGIITSAIADGTDDNIPKRIIRNTLIKVSTGRYYEMLPIRVPAECCVIGDELRSTNVQPRKSTNSTLVDIFDSQFSYAALERIENIIGDVVQGVAVTPSTNNLEVQSREFPFAVESTATGAAQAVRTIRKEIDFKLGQKLEVFPLPNPGTYDVEYGYARDTIRRNKDFILAEVVSYISNNYPDLKYSKTKCKQDIGYILDGISYDLTYGGNWQSVNVGNAYYAGTGGPFQIDSEEKTATLAAYAYLKDILAPIARNITVSPLEQTAVVQVSGESGSVASAATVEDLMDDIITTINTGTAPSITYPVITSQTAGLQTDHAALLLTGNLTTVKSNVITFITNNFPDLDYNQSKCERDIELLVTAAAYDAVFGTSFASTVAGQAYRRSNSNKVYGDQKDATIAANLYAAEQFKALVSEAQAIESIDFVFQTANDMIFAAAVNEASVKQTAIENNWHASRQLELNKDFIISEVHAWMDEYFADTVSLTVNTGTLTISDTSWLSINMPIRFRDGDDSAQGVENAGLSETTTYYVRNILSPTTFTISTEENGIILSLLDNTVANFEVYAQYNYDEAICARDVTEYLDAVKWDLTYPREFIREYSDNIKVVLPSNYKSKYAARYYVNSVIGCQEEEFFLLRNGTGLRLMTLDGLQGDLGPKNEFGTRRPTAGAYASLDPGWGPLDRRVWITARSPYVQNISTFGFGATGQRIDGALHDGGNDSIVSNDFTQVISDGIGAHVLNNGRAELVSVFTYYSHIGYLSESGGRIRGTNGNNSYGTFGSVAEGVDGSEIPVTAVVDNRLQYNAAISNVATDQDQILTLEYNHAGNDYTEAEMQIFGAGDSEILVYDDKDFREAGVFQARLTELNDSSGEAGGEGYSLAQNTAQSGTTSTITIAATDGSISSAYIGMTIILTGGTAAGQYGIIDDYNSGTKLVSVVRELNVVTAGSFQVGEQYRIDTVGTTDYSLIGASVNYSQGEIFTATGAGTGTGTATLLEAGWSTFAPGREKVAPNASTTYRIEPSVTFTAPERSDSSNSALPSSADWNDIEYFASKAVYTNQTGTASGSGTGAVFDITRVAGKYYVAFTLDGNDDPINVGTGYSRLETITVQGSNLGGQNSTNDVVITITSVNDLGEIQGFEHTGLAQAGLFVAINGGTAAATSIDGSTWSAMTMPSAGGSGWYRLQAGGIDDGSTLIEEKYLVATSNGSTTGAYSIDGINWTTFAFSGGTATPSLAFGSNNFVRIASDSQTVERSGDGGQNWSTFAGVLPATGYNALVFGAGKFVAVRSGTNDVAYSTDNGQNWTTATLPGTNETWTDVGYGNNMFFAIASTNNQGAVSPDGVNWYGVTMPAGAWSKITFGNGVFMATKTNADGIVAISQNGYFWETYNLSSAGAVALDGIAYGNPNQSGRFITFVSGTTNANYRIFAGARAQGRPGVANSQVFEIRLFEPGGNYTGTPPDIAIVDPGNIYDATFDIRVGNGVLAQPSFYNRGVNFEQASAEIFAAGSNGFADFFQTGDFVAVRQLTERPVPGSNVVFDSLPDQTFKLVNTVSFLGTTPGSYTAFLQLSPNVEINDSPIDGDGVTMRIRFSQVRLTGHDFLDIGTGNFDETNYPGTPLNDPVQDNETTDSDGGRVFFTSTDQDGNFRVGDLFAVEQSTGVATLNAEAFNIAGLQELSLGEVTLGGNSASITEFSTDPFFTANSDTVVPTQRAVKAYIEAQIGGGGASLNVNSVTAGDVFISSNVITTVESEVINIQARVNFQGGITGYPLAYNYMLR